LPRCDSTERVEAMWKSIRAGVVTGIIAVSALLLVRILSGEWEETLFLTIPLFYIVLGASVGLAAGVLAHVILKMFPSEKRLPRSRKSL